MSDAVLSADGPTSGAGAVARFELRGALADDVAVYVRDLILTGAIRPGAKIDQDELGRVLGVSRSPIREALVVLGKEGLVDITPRRGAYVAAISRDDIIDHYELFGAISGRAAAMAAELLSDDDLVELADVHASFDTAAPGQLSALNGAFHRVINRVAPRRTRWLIELLLQSVPANYFEFADGWNAQAVEHHGEILDALRSRDPERARHAMEAHLHAGGAAAVASLDQQGFWE